MSVVFKQKVESVPSATASATITFVTTADILVGEDIIIGLGRTALSTTTNGITSITASTGAGTFERAAVSCRASTYDMALARLRVTTLIPAGATVTATCPDTSTKRGGVLQVVAGLTSATAHRTTGTSAQGTVGNVNGGAQGSSTGMTGTLGATSTVPDLLIIGAMASGGATTNTITPTGGATELGEARTVSGSADRGVMLQYKIVSANAIHTATATQVTNGGWALAAAAWAIDMTPPPPTGPVFKEWNGSAWVTLTPKEWNGTAWVTVAAEEL